MMRNSIQNKLKEQKGASLVLALFLLIVVTVVATIIVNSAFSNAGRVRRNIRAEQNYLTVSSAAELVKSYLGDVTMVYTETETKNGGSGSNSTSEEYSFTDARGSSGISDISKSDNPFASQLIKWLENKNNSLESNATYIIKSDGMKPVQVKLSIDKANFVDKGSSGSSDMDKATTYIIANLSMAKDAAGEGSGETTGNTLSAKNGDENYYMSVKIPFTSVWEETTVTNSGGTRSAADEGYDTELSSFSDEPDEANYSDEPDEANFLDDTEDDLAAFADDGSTEVTTTTWTWTVQTASAKGESNNIDIEKGVKQSSTN